MISQTIEKIARKQDVTPGELIELQRWAMRLEFAPDRIEDIFKGLTHIAQLSQIAYDLGKVIAGEVTTGVTLDTNTANFGGRLSSSDSTVQKALDTLDDHSHVIPLVLRAGCASFNPADATTYYIGHALAAAPITTADANRVYVPAAGHITRVDIGIFHTTGLGSAETSTMSLRLNNTTDTTLSSAIVNNTSTSFHATGLNVAVVAGDYFEIKWVTPTWVTNPLGVNVTAQVYISA